MRYNVKQLDKKVWVIYLIFNINESSGYKYCLINMHEQSDKIYNYVVDQYLFNILLIALCVGSRYTFLSQKLNTHAHVSNAGGISV